MRTECTGGEESAARAAFVELKAALNAGTVRAAERGADGTWHTNTWVKAGILLGFRLGRLAPAATGGPFQYFDKDTYQLRPVSVDDGIRIVPGGSSIRDGCFVARGVVCVPPMWINAGAYVDEGTLVDSHALVGAAPRSASACISRRRHRSEGCSSPPGRCRSSSKTTCWLVGTAGCTRAPS